MLRNNPLAFQGLFNDSLQMPSGLIVPKHSAEALIKAQAKQLQKETNKAQLFSKFAMQNNVIWGARQKPQGTPMFPLLYEASEKSFIDAILINSRVGQMKRIWQKANDGKNKEVGFKVVHKRHDDKDYKGGKSDDARCREMEALLNDPTPAEFTYLYPHGIRPHARLKDFVTVETKAELIIDRKVMLKYRRRDGQGFAAFHWMPGETILPVDESLREWAKKNEHEGKVGRNTADRMSSATGFDIANSAFVQIIDGMLVGAYTSDEISVHISNPSDRLNRWGYGQSRLETSIDVSTMLLRAWTYNRGLFDTNYPDSILTVAGDFDTEGLQAFKQQINGEAGGNGNHSRLPIIPSGDMDNFKLETHKLRDTPRDMLFDKLIRLLLMLKCSAYGAHPSTINLEMDSGEGGAPLSAPDPAAEIEFSKEQGLVPMLTDMADWLTAEIVTPRYDDLKVIIVGMKPEDEKTAVEIRSSRVSKWMTKNECRMEEGLQPIGFYLSAEDYNKLKDGNPQKAQYDTNPWNWPADVPSTNYLNTFQMLAQPQPQDGDEEDQGQAVQKSLLKSQKEPIKFLHISLDDQL